MSIDLQEAVREGRLSEFIAQEEARGIGPIDRAEFDATIAALVKRRNLRRSKERSQARARWAKDLLRPKRGQQLRLTGLPHGPRTGPNESG
jgi:hypothetical protein